MPTRLTTTDIQLDARTSRAVAQGIGEKLRQSLDTEGSFPERLQRLLDEMHDREVREDRSKGGG